MKVKAVGRILKHRERAAGGDLSSQARERAPLDDGELLDRQEAAVLLNISPRTLDRWALLREGPPRVQLGRKTIRYRRASLEAWLISRETVGPRSAPALGIAASCSQV